MRINKFKSFAFLAALVLIALALSGCSRESAGEHNARIMHGYTLNSSTEEPLDDFGYMFDDIYNDRSAIRDQKYEDVVTVLAVNYGGDMRQIWLYDAKRGMVFHSIGELDRLSESDKACVLSDGQREQFIKTLDNAGTHRWKRRYPGFDIGTGSYSWDVVIEYRDGVFEEHFGWGVIVRTPKGFHDILQLLRSYDYGENPLN